MKSIHAPTTTQCKICDKICKSKIRLSAHLKIHDEDQKIECTHCKKFILKHNMKLHVDRVHLGLKQYSCTHCSIKMADPAAMKRHVKYKHETEKNFKCQFCSFAFKMIGDLNKHVKRCHNDSVSFKCEKCDRIFSAKHNCLASLAPKPVMSTGLSVIISHLRTLPLRALPSTSQ